MQFNEGTVHTREASADMGIHLRVKLTSNKLALAGSTDKEVGTLVRNAFNTVMAPYRLRNAPGTTPMIASEAITAGNEVFAGANGKVSATGTIAIGTAFTASAADGDILEVLRY